MPPPHRGTSERLSGTLARIRQLVAAFPAEPPQGTRQPCKLPVCDRPWTVNVRGWGSCDSCPWRIPAAEVGASET